MVAARPRPKCGHNVDMKYGAFSLLRAAGFHGDDVRVVVYPKQTTANFATSIRARGASQYFNSSAACGGRIHGEDDALRWTTTVNAVNPSAGSVRADRFFSAASHFVSKWPIWLGEAALP